MKVWLASLLVAFGLLGAVSARLVPVAAKSPAQIQPLGTHGKWKLSFDDEFNGSGLDKANWYPTCPWAVTLKALCSNLDGSLSCEDPSNVSVANGDLILQAKRRNTKCKGMPRAHFTGAWVDSFHFGKPIHVSFKQGFIEARIKEPDSAAGNGFWAGLWGIPIGATVYGRELDIAEWQSKIPRHMQFYYHWPCAHPVCQLQETWGIAHSYSSGWHVFGVNYETGRIAWYVDGHRVFTWSSSKIRAVPFDIRMTFEINGRRVDPVSPSTKLPQRMLVDYVRIWRAG